MEGGTMMGGFLWVPFTLLAAFAQVLRNGAQAGLTAKIGTLGATQVRFVFGFPFALLFLAAGLALTGESMPRPGTGAIAWCAAGALAQIGATALMLVVMRQRAFGVAYAYIKTEPVIVAVFGALLLHDALPATGWLAVVIVTLGVLATALKPGEVGRLFSEAVPALTGILAGSLFGFSAVAFRGAIEELGGGHYLINSLTMLVLSLGIQTAVLGLWLALRDRQAFLGSLREWRGSLGAGFLGALASACWFLAFSLTNAANVRTLALVELPFAALVSLRVSGRVLERREAAGFALILAGVALLIVGHA